MSKKRLNREEQIEAVQSKLDEARQARLEFIKNKAPKKVDSDFKVSFQEFWAQNRRSYGKGKELEEIIWLHLKAIKHDKPELFEAGIKHFGLTKIL